MELRFAHLSDFATVDASAKPTLVGIFDHVMCKPDADTIPFPGFHLIASFEASIAEGAEHTLQIAFVNDDEEVVGPKFDGPLVFRTAGVGHKARANAKPTTYTYADAAVVLQALGFVVAPHGGTSHRKWRALAPAGNSVIIGLVEKGSGTLKPYLVRDLVNQLRANDMIPSEFGEA